MTVEELYKALLTLKYELDNQIGLASNGQLVRYTILKEKLIKLVENDSRRI